MERALVNGTEIEFEVTGEGEPALLIHGAFVADAFYPLVGEPALAGRYRLIRYHRRGYLGSATPTGPITVADHAADALSLLQHLGIAQAHVAGHSYGGLVGLQLALDAPEAVASLALLEPALPGALFASPDVGNALAAAFPAFLVGDVRGALDAVMTALGDPDYRRHIERNMPPGAFDAIVKQVRPLLDYDLPAMREWSFGAAEAARVRQPLLAVVGARTFACMRAAFAQAVALLPQAQTYELPEATHLLMIMNARDMAERLAAFWGGRPPRSPDPLSATS
jgi:pimeloyl-ACP methyl ester carboxylesterase